MTRDKLVSALEKHTQYESEPKSSMSTTADFKFDDLKAVVWHTWRHLSRYMKYSRAVQEQIHVAVSITNRLCSCLGKHAALRGA